MPCIRCMGGNEKLGGRKYGNGGGGGGGGSGGGSGFGKDNYH